MRLAWTSFLSAVRGASRGGGGSGPAHGRHAGVGAGSEIAGTRSRRASWPRPTRRSDPSCTPAVRAPSPCSRRRLHRPAAELQGAMQEVGPANSMTATTSSVPQSRSTWHTRERSPSRSGGAVDIVSVAPSPDMTSTSRRCRDRSSPACKMAARPPLVAGCPVTTTRGHREAPLHAIRAAATQHHLPGFTQRPQLPPVCRRPPSSLVPALSRVAACQARSGCPLHGGPARCAGVPAGSRATPPVPWGLPPNLGPMSEASSP
jgi:hypothetical protein